MLIVSEIRVSLVSVRQGLQRTFVLTICRRRGEADGLSPAPTTATSEVQNSISTMDAAPSSVDVQGISADRKEREGGEQTLGVDLAKGVTVDDTVSFPCTDRDAAARESQDVSGVPVGSSSMRT